MHFVNELQAARGAGRGARRCRACGGRWQMPTARGNIAAQTRSRHCTLPAYVQKYETELRSGQRNRWRWNAARRLAKVIRAVRARAPAQLAARPSESHRERRQALENAPRKLI
ncbi:hypothetical protein EVAR_51843_1 [Eumeta japonica]|uniref:Uncharacterized protein n=1 Tax=Eumeta variegata TaxID=151549 RepID=A0A4C1YT57_EUMVA|nr:hypothetical protein EVAR_51843_1 [Eumeta japonica]